MGITGKNHQKVLGMKKNRKPVGVFFETPPPNSIGKICWGKVPFNLITRKNEIGLGFYIFTIINRHLMGEMLGEKVAIQVGNKIPPALKE